MDGGIGEAALMSAIIGGGSAAVTGGDPLKGALIGGLTGGVMGGMGGLSGVDSVAAQTQAANAANSGITGASGLSTLPSGVSPAVTQLGGATNAVSSATNAAASQPFSMSRGLDIVKANPFTYGSIAASQALPGLLKPPTINAPGTEKYSGPLSKFRYDPNTYEPDVVVPPSPAYRPVYAAEGGIMQLAPGGIAGSERGIMFPQSQQDHTQFATSSQYPAQAVGNTYEPKVDPYTGQEMGLGMARGGIADLGGYSDGGRMLKGPGDGMSDSIPASIGNKQPARLADGEFVVPADVVSHLGNGSTDAGAKQLYKMMDKVRTARTGRKAQGKQINPKKYMPA